MGPESQHQPSSYPLRLSASVLSAVRLRSRNEGLSINHFIELALVEKLARLDAADANRLAVAALSEQGQQQPARTQPYPGRTVPRDAAVADRGVVGGVKKSFLPPDAH